MEDLPQIMQTFDVHSSSEATIKPHFVASTTSSLWDVELVSEIRIFMGVHDDVNT